jgi:hypothetical protein
MIRDLSETLKEILMRSPRSTEFPDLRAARIVFDRPTDQFKPSQTSINLFLYDIRENLQLRSYDETITRQNGQGIITPPPMRVDCSYLITAWPVGSTGDEMFLQEHRLLSQSLQVFARYATIPEEFLRGTLKNQEQPIPIKTSHIDSLKTTGEFWSALGNQLRPSISVTATISMKVWEPELPVTLVIAVDVKLESQPSPVNPTIFFQGSPNDQTEFFRISGRITNADNQPVANATVTLVQTGWNATTDTEGRYSLSPLQRGTYDLEVRSPNITQSFQITIPPVNSSSYNLQFS